MEIKARVDNFQITLAKTVQIYELFDSLLQRVALGRMLSIAGGWDFAGSVYAGAVTLIQRFGGALNLISPDVSVTVSGYEKAYRPASHPNWFC